MGRPHSHVVKPSNHMHILDVIPKTMRVIENHVHNWLVLGSLTMWLRDHPMAELQLSR